MNEPIILSTCDCCGRKKSLDNMRKGLAVRTNEGVKVPLICPACFPDYRAALQTNKEKEK